MLLDFITCKYDKWVPVTTAWRVVRLRMEERPLIWRVAANVLRKQSGQPTRGVPPAWVLSEVLTTPHPENVFCYEILTGMQKIKVF
jgi:hypothetical protein